MAWGRNCWWRGSSEGGMAVLGKGGLWGWATCSGATNPWPGCSDPFFLTSDKFFSEPGSLQTSGLGMPLLEVAINRVPGTGPAFGHQNPS